MNRIANRIFVATALTVCISSAAHAQSFNIDIGLGDPPPSTYGAAGLAGEWMKLPGTQGVTVFNLIDIDGNVTNARMSQIGGTETVTLVDRDLAGDDATLMNDCLITHSAVENCLFFRDMEPGDYEVRIYARMPAMPEIMAETNCDQEPGNPHELVGGEWPGAHAEGISYSLHTAIVTDSGPNAGNLFVHSGVPSGGSFTIGAALNAIQIRKLIPIAGDLDGDGDVDFDDFTELLASWGDPGCNGALPCPADLDGDGDVDFDDFTTLLANWS